jgi:DNA-binding CsgD family transcriptional regulator
MHQTVQNLPGLAKLGETLDLLAKSGEPAFAIDAADRIVFWNKACEELLGRPAQQVLGKRCYDVIGGRDENGNIYCYRNCPVAFQAREQPENPVQRFTLTVSNGNGHPRRISVSMFAIPAVRPSLSTVVHVLHPEAGPPTKLEQGLAASSAEQPRPRWQIEAPEGQPAELTTREQEILRLLAEGLPTPAIARRLAISATTVRNHVQNILHKLDVHTKLAAVAFAYRNDLI